MAYHNEIPKQPSGTPDLCACPSSMGQLGSWTYSGKGTCFTFPGEGLSGPMLAPMEPVPHGITHQG